MRTQTRLAAYSGAALILALAGGFAAGALTGNPWDSGESDQAVESRSTENHGSHQARANAAAAEAQPAGLMVSNFGYTLELVEKTMPAGSTAALAYRILDHTGKPLTSFEKNHDKEMHLIAVRRDTSGFQHVHPKLDANGTWTVPLNLVPGSWRILADFVPGGGLPGKSITLGADLAVPGEYKPEKFPAPSSTATVEGGYVVALTGELVAGRETELTFSISRNGKRVVDVEPYLAAYGHLVALREGDLAYVHMHPDGHRQGTPGTQPDLTFRAAAPSAGTYRLFLDFKHAGKVHTAGFTLPAGRLKPGAEQFPSDGHVHNDEAGHGGEHGH